MREREPVRYRPGLEPLEAKRLPSGGPPAAPLAGRAAQRADGGAIHQPRAPVRDLTVSRITNPTPVNARLIPPFRQVRVQANEPVPGREYNVLYITLRNSTRRTFTAADQLAVRLTVQGPSHAYPLLRGDETWRPGEVFVLYVLTKQDYINLLRPTRSAGFSFNFADPRTVAIPGPSGFFRRIRYNPETFPRVLDTIVKTNPEGRGHHLGLPNTSLWQVVPPREADVL